MNATEMSDYRTHITCSESTRDLVKTQKRGGESYDDLLQKMVKQYNPDEAAEDSAADA